MGFWYFLLLFVGIYFIVQSFRKRTMSTGKKIGVLLVGVLFVGVAIFMFQDGSAEFVANLLNLLV